MPHGSFALVVATGGTGLGPRDRTPQTLHALLDYEIPGFGEQMRAFGRTRTHLADLSRSLAGVLDSTLVIAVPGSVSGATESARRHRAAAQTRAGDPGRAHAARRTAWLMAEHIPFYPLAPILFVVAVVAFALLMARHLRIFAYARPATITESPGRLRSVFVYTIAQVRMFRDLDAGIMHATIFWGFVILTVGTADRISFGLVHTIVGAPLDGWLWRLLVLGQNMFVFGVLVMTIYALFRRLVWRYPRRTTLSRDSLVILFLIGGVVLSEWFAEGFRLARYGDPDMAWAVLAGPLSSLLGGVFSANGQQAGYTLFFWANVALVSGFLVYLPYSKHLHIVTAFFNAGLRKMRPRGELPAMDLEAADARFGIKTIEDLSWKDLLDGFTCTECGRCQEACPAWATGKPLNPKTMIMGIREMSVESEAGISIIPWRGAPQPAGLAESVVDKAIPYDGVWDCLTCGACVEACPVMIEHVDKIVGLRRNLVLEESRFPEELASSFNNMERYQNIWGQPQESRLDWAKGLPFDVPTAAARRGRRWRGCRGRAGVPVLGRLRGVLRRPQSAGRSGCGQLPQRGRRQVRGARPGRIVHGRPGPPDGQ